MGMLYRHPSCLLSRSKFQIFQIFQILFKYFYAMSVIVRLNWIVSGQFDHATRLSISCIGSRLWFLVQWIQSMLTMINNLEYITRSSFIHSNSSSFQKKTQLLFLLVCTSWHCRLPDDGVTPSERITLRDTTPATTIAPLENITSSS